MKNNSNKDKKISHVNYSELLDNSAFKKLDKIQNRFSDLPGNNVSKALADKQNLYSKLLGNNAFKKLDKIQNIFSDLPGNNAFKALADMQNSYSKLLDNSVFKEFDKIQNRLGNNVSKALANKQNLYSKLLGNSTFKKLDKIQNIFSDLPGNNAFKALADTQKLYSKLLGNTALKSLEKIQNVSYYALQNNSASGIISKMNYSTDILNTTMKNLNKIISENKNMFDELDKQSKVTDYEKENDTLDRNIVFNSVDACLKQDISFQQKIHNIFENFKKINPIYWLLIYVLLINPLLDYYNVWWGNLINTTILNVKSKSTNNEVEDKKVIKYNVNNNINIYVDDKDMKSDILKKYRFVTTQALYVRINHSIKSRVVGKIYFGQSVRIIRKKKNWTLVEVDQKNTNDKIIGWVFTRYISRFD